MTNDLTIDPSAVIGAADSALVTLERMPRSERAEMLRALAREVSSRAEVLVEQAHDETGLEVADLSAEVARTVGQLGFFADVVDEGSFVEATIDHDLESSSGDLRRLMGAVGTVGVFGPSNFPFAYGVLGTDVASALAAGCSVVVKAHPSHLRTARLLHACAERVLDELGLPAGTIGLVEGFEAGVVLANDARVQAIGFVGSVGGGRALFDLCAARPAPVPFYGELGSLNTVVVLPGAARERGHVVAETIGSSMLARKGQMCTKPGLVLVPAGADGDRVAERWAEQVDAWQPGRLLDDAVRSRFVSGARALLERPGARVVAGVPTQDGASTDPVSALVVEVSAADFVADADAFVEECFGPAAVMVRYDSDDELFGALSQIPSALVAGLHADVEHDAEIAPRVVQCLSRRAGRVVWGAPTTGLRVAWATHHGGRYPASTAAAHSAVGAPAVRRWLVPLCLQGFPDALLPDELSDGPSAVVQRVDGVLTSAAKGDV